ncbi:TonB-dependent hemoglobin/transferrin/lactoferrin family receptor [Paucibacter sp. Y2R2-4]|uniref:TonB-dependent hemoglobin/transferrin/lactoferrin family receptor n=1 Tax=Paucibacter sp. Y2R2-4 TaxID=2893553 RepID=UPI0021E47D4F|nr:TonB-dependent hemoglobin/transferrin/lactoferrin family receptor [Paucibacter sp. Y2R2-4]MCV2350480.1 TonB-dependent hemoglobin/transferrin/lactoferrin family receptor [Paucibacter sp. Y2R2-4]
MLLRKTPVALALVACFAPITGQAQESPSTSPEATRLGEITVSATRTERAGDAVPNTVTVYDKKRLQQRDARDLKDLLEGEVDLAVRAVAPRFTAAGSSTGRGGNEGINIRGLEGNQVLMMIDGIRMPQSFSFGAFSSGRVDFIDPDMLVSAEVLRGPASTQFGSDGLAGALSLRTLSPEDLLGKGKTQAGFLSASALSVDRSTKLTGAFAGAAGAWQGLVMATVRRGHETRNSGENEAANSSRTRANPSDIRSESVMAKASLKIDASQHLLATVDARRRKVDTEVLSARAASFSPSTPTAVVDLDAQDQIDRTRVSLEHKWEDLNADWLQSLKTQVYVQRSKTRQYSSEDRYVSPDRIRDGLYEEQLIGLSSQAQTQLSGHRLSYGIDLSRNRINGLRDGTVPPAGESFPSKPFPDTDYTLGGAFVQDEIEAGNFSVIPALRFEHYSLKPKTAGYSGGQVVSLSDQALTPRLGLIWRASAGFQPYAQWALGFRAPTPDQVNNGFANPAQGYRSIGNANLKAEHANSLEMGLRGKLAEALRWQLSAYENRYRNFIGQETVSGSGTPADPLVFQYVNLAKARIRGVEARLMWQPLSGLHLSGAIAKASGKTERDGVSKPLDTVQPLRANLAARWELGDWDLQAAWLHSAAKQASATSSASNFLTPSYDVIDVGAAYRIQPGLRIAAYVSNLTDQKYWRWSDVRGIAATSPVLDAYTAPGRQLQLSMRADY